MVMSAKYIPASLLTVSRMLDRAIPRFIDFVILFCIIARAKTATSVGAVRWVIEEWRAWEVCEEIPTEDKREGQLNNHESLLNVGKT